MDVAILTPDKSKMTDLIVVDSIATAQKLFPHAVCVPANSAEAKAAVRDFASAFSSAQKSSEELVKIAVAELGKEIGLAPTKIASVISKL